MNPNFRFPDPVPEYRDPEFVPVTNSSLGSVACDPLDYDSGSSVEFAHYTLPLPVYVRDLGADDMPLGVVGFVFNFPYEIVRTPARVAHIFGADLARHTGQGLIAVNGGDDIVFTEGGRIEVGSGGMIYVRWIEDPMDVPSSCWVAVPIGGRVIFYGNAEEMADVISGI